MYIVCVKLPWLLGQSVLFQRYQVCVCGGGGGGQADQGCLNKVNPSPPGISEIVNTTSYSVFLKQVE